MVLWSITYKAYPRGKISHLINYGIVHNTNCWNFSNCKTNGDTDEGEPTDSIIIANQCGNTSASLLTKTSDMIITHAQS